MGSVSQKCVLSAYCVHKALLGVGDPSGTKNPNSLRLGVFSGRFLPGPGAFLGPAFPNCPGAGAGLGPSQPHVAPAAARVVVTSRPRGVGRRRFPGRTAVYIWAKFAARRPGAVPGGCRRHLRPLPLAAALAPHSSELSNNFSSEGGWAGARGARPGPRCLPRHPRRGSRCRTRRGSRSPCARERRLRRGGGEGLRAQRSSEFPPAVAGLPEHWVGAWA